MCRAGRKLSGWLGIIQISALWQLCRHRHNCHWTGHASRLDRKLTGKHGSKDYAREELVAEMVSAFLCADKEIIPALRHSDYIAHWLTILKEDKRAIFRAASLASMAADFILSHEGVGT